MNNIFLKRMNKEVMLYQTDNFTFPNLIIQPSDSLDVWYFLIYDLKDTPYENGLYLGKVLLPGNYPFKAPDFVFLTESGRFHINNKICTSFSGFHNDLFSPAWNIASMCSGLVSFMTDNTNKQESKGIGGIYELPDDDIKIIAKDSIEKMFKNPIFIKHFKELYKGPKPDIKEEIVKKPEPEIIKEEIIEEHPIKPKRKYTKRKPKPT